ncbi:hypothetical protein V2J09_001584 [Rumex salicifolius]
MEDDHHLLELTLISAQGLKSPFSSNMRRLQTFAVTWIQASTKLRTRIDRVGSENPTWNDKFLFRVSPSFLAGETSAITVEVFAVGILKDTLLGSVRILLSSFLPSGRFLPTASPSAPPSVSSSTPDLRLPRIRTPAFGAFQIRRPSGRFQGILNVAAVVVDISDFGSLAGLTAIGYHDLMREKSSNRRKHDNQKCKRSGKSEAGEDSSVDDSCGGDFTEASDGGESTTSTSSAASAAASPRILREMNGQELNHTECGGGGILCWLNLPRKIHISPSDENFRVLCSSQQIKRQ